MKPIYGIAILATLIPLTAPAQDADAQKQVTDTLKTLRQMTIVRVEGGVMSNVKNAPYRADQITETTQTLGDGTRIHNEHRVTIYRDSQGRVRREQPNNEVSIWDPTAEASYTLNPDNMTARKMHLSVSVNSVGEARPGGVVTLRTGTAIASDMPFVFAQRVTDGGANTATVTVNGLYATASKTAKKESLGTQTMEGVNAQGERQTTTIEAGAIGNDRPMQIVEERWYSPALQMDVMTRHSDPRSGEETMRLVNIDRSEPDPSLFQVPAAYQIVEGPGGRGGRGGR